MRVKLSGSVELLEEVQAAMKGFGAEFCALGLPSAPLFLLLGVDPLLDMGRTAVNVLGNCLASVIMAKWEGEYAAEQPSPSVEEAVNQ